MVLVPVHETLSVTSMQNKRLQINTHTHMSAYYMIIITQFSIFYTQSEFGFFLSISEYNI